MVYLSYGRAHAESQEAHAAPKTAITEQDVASWVQYLHDNAQPVIFYRNGRAVGCALEYSKGGRQYGIGIFLDPDGLVHSSISFDGEVVRAERNLASMMDEVFPVDVPVRRLFKRPQAGVETILRRHQCAGTRPARHQNLSPAAVR